MSIFVEIISTLLQAQTVQTCAEQVNGAAGGCPATAFNPIAAAFATQGYFMQADVLYYLTSSSFGVWAPFLYLIAAAGGIISMALGAPPKMYVWFFIGPGIYYWLIETRLPAHGVQWQVGSEAQDQRSVWRMAHVGIKNSSLVARMAGKVQGYGVDTEYEQGGVAQEADAKGWCKPTQAPVFVSNFFLQFDDVVSYTVRRLVDMTGITRVSEVGDFGSHAASTSSDPNRWYLTTDKKWVLLDTITSARLSSANLRDVFVTFLSSECGDFLSSTVDQASYVIAANSTTGNMPCTVMLHDSAKYSPSRTGATCRGTETDFFDDKYKIVRDKLDKKKVPVPDTARRLFQENQSGSLITYLNAGVAGASDGYGNKLQTYFTTADDIECHNLLYIIMQGFRWEASQIYSQLVRSGPTGLSHDKLLENLFYGWGARVELGGGLISKEDMPEWTRNLILVYLLKNEMAIAPRIADKKFSNQATLDSYSQNFTAQTGAKTKYGEIYSWARMVPYMQGIMLYLLAMGYPFACLMIVMPGKFKILFTWMSFWVWVKLWDAGFAVVAVLERSIWSMLGNSTKLTYTSPLIYQMETWSKTGLHPDTTCPADALFGDDKYCFLDMRVPLSCFAADAFFDGNGATVGAGAASGTLWWHTAALFDRALALASNIDMDVANGYYIYLMSALYFAVPAATGQLVLGAKAGVAGMVNGLVQGIQQDGGRGASGGFLGDFRGKAAAGAAALRQEAHAKGLRAGGFADQSIDQANASLSAGFHSGANDLINRQAGLKASSIGTGQSVLGARVSAAQSLTQAGQALGSTLAAFGASKVPSVMKNVGTEHIGTGLPSWIASHGLGGKDAFNGNADQSAPSTNQAAPSQNTGSKASGQPSASGSPDASGALFYSTSDGIRSISNLSSAMLNPIAHARSQLAAAGYSMQSADYSDAYGRQTLGLNAGQADRNLSSFDSSSAREAYGVGERRYGSAADFGAQTAVFNASAGLSDHAAGYIGSIGGDASVVSPTSKPTDITGMAMSGRLGMSTQTNANWAMTGFQSQRAEAVASLGNNYGSNYVTGGVLSDLNATSNQVQGIRQNTDGIGNRLVRSHLDVEAAKK